MTREEILCTPKKYVPYIHRFFSPIDLDPCSNSTSLIEAKMKYILPDHNGLKDPWIGKVYCNPPWGWPPDLNKHGMILSPWLNRCLTHYQEGGRILLYLPYMPKARWWGNYIECRAHGICAISPSESMMFNSKEDLLNQFNPFHIDTAFVYFGDNLHNFSAIFSQLGELL